MKEEGRGGRGREERRHGGWKGSEDSPQNIRSQEALARVDYAAMGISPSVDSGNVSMDFPPLQISLPPNIDPRIIPTPPGSYSSGVLEFLHKILFDRFSSFAAPCSWKSLCFLCEWLPSALINGRVMECVLKLNAATMNLEQLGFCKSNILRQRMTTRIMIPGRQARAWNHHRLGNVFAVV